MISRKTRIDVGCSWPLAQACNNCAITCLNVQLSLIVADSLVVESIGVSIGSTIVLILVVIDGLPLDLVKYECSASLTQTNQ